MSFGSWPGPPSPLAALFRHEKQGIAAHTARNATRGTVSPATVTPIIFHVTRLSDWQAAERSGAYILSTRDRTLEEVGFIHCSYAHQVAGVANAIYKGEQDLVLLVIDPVRLTAPVQPEPPAPGAEAYPHIYGPLNLEAVVEVRSYKPAADGTFQAPT